jgi:hypothetical protein
MITDSNLNKPSLFTPASRYNKESSKKTNEILQKGWGTLFRQYIYQHLPVDDISKLYCSNNGRPTKNLSTLLGLVIIQEIFGFTDSFTLKQLPFNSEFQHALYITTVDDKDVYIAPRTYYYFRHKLLENNLGEKLFKAVTDNLTAEFKLVSEFQRLDSVHISSNMKKVGRLGLMAATVKKFLTSLKKLDRAAYDSLDTELVGRYFWKDYQGIDYFGNVKSDRRQETITTVANDMLALIVKFETIADVASTKSWKLMNRVFNEQCVVVSADKIQVSLKAQDDVVPTTALKSDNNLEDNSNDSDEFYELESIIESEDVAETPLVTMEQPTNLSDNLSPDPSNQDVSYSSANTVEASINVPEDTASKATLKSVDSQADDESEKSDPVIEPAEAVVAPLVATMRDPKDVPCDSVQYPTDPDATYSHHKGKGYHVQIVETYSPCDNPDIKPLNLITYVEVHGAHQSDNGAVKTSLTDLEARGLTPEKLTADTAYGSDANHQFARNLGVEFTFAGPRARDREEGCQGEGCQVSQ